MVFVRVLREKHEVADERQKQFHDAYGAVESPDEKSFDVDDDVLSEFGFLQTFDPGETVGEIRCLIDFVVLRRVDLRNFEFEFLESGFRKLADFLDEAVDFFEHVVGYFFRQLRFVFETLPEFVQTFRDLDFLG